MESKEFNPNDALDAIKSRIKDVYVSLIPEEQWNEMVKNEIDRYFKRGDSPNAYGNSSSLKVSNFAHDVHAVLMEETKRRTREYLQNNFTQQWDQNGVPRCNQLIEEMITKNSGKILADMIGGIFQNSIAQAGYRI